MKYDNVRLTQMLAAEYALGTLAGRARLRFARLLAARADLRRELQFWEARFAPLLEGSKPVPPRAIVWAEIDARIQRSTVVPMTPSPAPTVSNTAWIWQTWAIAASAALVAVSVQLYRHTLEESAAPPPVVATATPPAAPYVSMLQAKASDALWLVSVDPQKREISVVAQGDYALDAQRESLELWLIGEDGKPLPLGLLPLHGRGRMPMPGGVAVPVKAVLAISREPHGGSPTGQPTGPVISSGPLLSL